MSRRRLLTALTLCLSVTECLIAQTNKVAPKTVPRSSQKIRLFNPETMAKPAAGYSQIAEVSGAKLVYIAGQVAIDRSGNLVGKDDFQAQARQVFENLKAAVEAAGGDFSHIIKLNYYCAAGVDNSQMPALREIRDKYVNTSSPPTSTLVFVQRLVRPEYLLEVDAIAAVDK